jgi:hypothetical protein
VALTDQHHCEDESGKEVLHGYNGGDTWYGKE